MLESYAVGCAWAVVRRLRAACCNASAPASSVGASANLGITEIANSGLRSCLDCELSPAPPMLAAEFAGIMRIRAPKRPSAARISNLPAHRTCAKDADLLRVTLLVPKANLLIHHQVVTPQTGNSCQRCMYLSSYASRTDFLPSSWY